MKPDRFNEIVAKSKVEVPTFHHTEHGKDEFIYDQRNGLLVNIKSTRGTGRIGFNLSEVTLADFRFFTLSEYKAFGL